MELIYAKVNIFFQYFNQNLKWLFILCSKHFFLILKIDCSLEYCKKCSDNICSECISSYYFYENKSCCTFCDTEYEIDISGSLYCKSKLDHIII